MKITRKISLLLAALLVLGSLFRGALAEEEVYHIGIIQIIRHPALDSATQGFEEALIERLGEDKVTFEVQDAQGDSVNCATIVNGFVAAEVDLIMANGTAALQASFTGTEIIPIIGASITSYADALDLDDFDGTTGYNVSGVSDLAPLDQQAELLHTLFPDAKKVGLLYCNAESNSLYQINAIEPYLQSYGYETVRYGFSDSNDIATVTTTACAECDVLYTPTDNIVANNTEVINNICLPAAIPVVCGEEGICGGCGVATLSPSYYDIGYAAGVMAYDVLVNGADISTMPVQYAPEVYKKYNVSNCEALNVTVPDDYEPIENS